MTVLAIPPHVLEKGIWHYESIVCFGVMPFPVLGVVREFTLFLKGCLVTVVCMTQTLENVVGKG